MLEGRSWVRGSVVGPFSHVAFLLSCVVSSEFKQLSPIGSKQPHSLHIHWLRANSRKHQTGMHMAYQTSQHPHAESLAGSPTINDTHQLTFLHTTPLTTTPAHYLPTPMHALTITPPLLTPRHTVALLHIQYTLPAAPAPLAQCTASTTHVYST